MQRLLVLAAAALVAALVTLAVDERRGAPAAAIAQGAVAPGGWYDALASSRGPAGDAERTTCGLILTERSLGVTHPVLPCGAKLLIRFGDETLLTEVIDNTPKRPTSQFELTESMARRIGLDGVQRVEWRFAAKQNG